MVEHLPKIEAVFNGIALFCMVNAVIYARKRRLTAHRKWMMGALASSGVFLGCYLTYHFLADAKVYQGSWGVIYYPILVTHIILAALVPFLVAWVVFLGFRRSGINHRRIARWVFPIWGYVSVTGILVFFFVHT